MIFILNMSLDKGVLPEDWKLSRIKPLFKGKGSRNKVCNYRPISITNSISKIAEKLIYNRLMSFVVKENILSNKQHGFRSKNQL
ncbi:MAG: hypothetical protein FD143_3565 [Ignavibacteria bacterium]|nr:MAG: hypothetical protein FD143_3565 [Ignavibacteria bacterium]